MSMETAGSASNGIVASVEQTNKQSQKRKNKEIPFDVVAKNVMAKWHILTIEDTKEVYLYKNGLYSSRGAETAIEKYIQTEFANVFYDINQEWLDQMIQNGSDYHIPVPKTGYIKEVMNYIKRHTAKFRDDIDRAYPYLINLKNGMFDVKRWILLPHDPCYFSIRQIPITYDPEAKCPMMDKFLAEVVSEKDAKVLIEFAGYSLIPETHIQKAIMLYGEGANGKSVFLKFMIKFIGDENVSGVSLQSLEADKFKVASLYGKLLNIYPDLKDQAIYSSDIFKTLVGGDRIQGEKKYMDSFEFYNTARLMFSANKIPEIKNNEFAYFRRWILINFPNQFEEGKNDDKHLFEKLITDDELSGFLNHALEGLKNVLVNDKFSYDLTIEDVKQLYKYHSSSVGAFAENCLIMSATSTVKTTMYEKYVEWCVVNNLKPIAPNMFGKKFKNLGYEDSSPYNKQLQDKIAQWDNVAINYEKFRVETNQSPLSQTW